MTFEQIPDISIFGVFLGFVAFVLFMRIFILDPNEDKDSLL